MADCEVMHAQVKLESEGCTAALEVVRKEYDKSSAELTNLSMISEAEGDVREGNLASLRLRSHN